jgi:hypothetical protein
MERAMQLSLQRGRTESQQQGRIQGWQYTHEWAWNLLKGYAGSAISTALQ